MALRPRQIENGSSAETFGSDFARSHQQMSVVMSLVATLTWLVHSEINSVSIFLGELDCKLSRQLCAAGRIDLRRKNDEDFPTQSRIAPSTGLSQPRSTTLLDFLPIRYPDSGLLHRGG